MNETEGRRHKAEELRLLLATRHHAAEAADYPINPAMPRYTRVPIAREGEFTPTNWWGDGDGVFRPDRAYLQDLADSYDPQFYAATVNTDHWCWTGPAYGLILELYVEQAEDGVWTLYADLANVDRELAREIDEGKWPHRSIEWADALDDHAWLSANWFWFFDDPAEVPALESLLFYGKHTRYLTGLGLLGVRSPAVPNLGPVPQRSAGDPELLREYPAAARLLIPRAASAEEARALRVKTINPGSATGSMEDDMTNPKTAGQGAPPEKASSQPAETAEQKLARLEQANAELLQRAENAEKAKAAAEDRAGTYEETVRQAQAQAERAEKIALAQSREAELKERAAKHGREGKLSPAARAPYLELARQLHGMDSVETLSVSGAAAKSDKAPLDLLDELIAASPQGFRLGEAAGEDPARQTDREDGGNATRPAVAAEAIRARTAALQGKTTGGEQ